MENQFQAMFSEQVPGPYEDTTCQMVVSYPRRDHPDLETIRSFRDEVLKSTPAGSRLVDLYYSISRFTAPMVARSRFLKASTRFFVVKPSYLVSKTFL